MKKLLANINSNSRILLIVVFGYIIAQFLWWEVLLVRQNLKLIEENKKIYALTISDSQKLQESITQLDAERSKKIIMIVGEGTIFLLLLLFGINKIHLANKKERELLLQKNNFLLSITHELKTPLASNKLQLQTLKRHKLEEAKRNELLDYAIGENERLNQLIDNVLMAARMQQNDLPLNLEETNLSDLIHQIAVANYKAELDSHELELELSPEVRLRIDKILFPSIVTNLIDNAIKYSSGEKKIKVLLNRSGNEILLKISDSGSGISSADKAKVFDSFFRAGNEETRKTKGTGLGLFIVNYLVNKHHGRISIEDNTPCGTVFKLVFND